jgi:photosystem II stability/assembly factor-like uncharacterized protein
MSDLGIGRVNGTRLFAFLLSIGLFAQPPRPAVSIQRIHGRCVGCQRYQLGHLQLLGPNEGWASANVVSSFEGHVSQNSIALRTSDGGKTWKKVRGVEIYGVGGAPAFWFINARQGWLAWYEVWKPEDHLRRTTDGGRRWTELPATDSGDWVQLRFFDAMVGYAVQRTSGGSRFGTTTDGGNHWRFSDETLEPGGPGALFFLNQRVGWLGGGREDAPRLLRTIDGGATWQQAVLPANIRGTPIDLYFLDADHGWTILWDGFTPASPLLRTDDGGRTWSEDTSWTSQAHGQLLHQARYVSNSIGVLTFVTLEADDASLRSRPAESPLLLTFDGGRTWQRPELSGTIGGCQVVVDDVWCTSGMDVLKIRVQP